MNVQPQPHYSTREVAQMSGATLRQLQWWDEKGIVTPGKPGAIRLYDQTEALHAQAVAGLRKKRITMRSIRKISPTMRTAFASDALIEQRAAVYVCTDGDRAFVSCYADDVFQWLLRAQKPTVVVTVSLMARA